MDEEQMAELEKRIAEQKEKANKVFQGSPNPNSDSLTKAPAFDVSNLNFQGRVSKREAPNVLADTRQALNTELERRSSAGSQKLDSAFWSQFAEQPQTVAELPEPVEELGNLEAVGKGLARGFTGLGKGVLELVDLGTELFDGLGENDDQREGITRKMINSIQRFEQDALSFEDLEGVGLSDALDNGRFFTWLVANTSQAVPSLVPSFGAIKAASGLGKVGQLAAAVATGSAIETGAALNEVNNFTKENLGREPTANELTWAVGTGIMAGIVEGAADKFLFGKVFPGSKGIDEIMATKFGTKELAAEALKKELGKSFGRKVATEGVKGFTSESITESIQEGIAAFGEKHGWNEDLTTEEVMDAIGGSFLIGGIVGGGAAVLGTARQERHNRRALRNRLNNLDSEFGVVEPVQEDEAKKTIDRTLDGELNKRVRDSKIDVTQNLDDRHATVLNDDELFPGVTEKFSSAQDTISKLEDALSKGKSDPSINQGLVDQIKNNIFHAHEQYKRDQEAIANAPDGADIEVDGIDEQTMNDMLQLYFKIDRYDDILKTEQGLQAEDQQRQSQQEPVGTDEEVIKRASDNKEPVYIYDNAPNKSDIVKNVVDNSDQPNVNFVAPDGTVLDVKDPSVLTPISETLNQNEIDYVANTLRTSLPTEEGPSSIYEDSFKDPFFVPSEEDVNILDKATEEIQKQVDEIETKATNDPEREKLFQFDGTSNVRKYLINPDGSINENFYVEQFTKTIGKTGSRNKPILEKSWAAVENGKRVSEKRYATLEQALKAAKNYLKQTSELGKTYSEEDAATLTESQDKLNILNKAKDEFTKRVSNIVNTGQQVPTNVRILGTSGIDTSTGPITPTDTNGPSSPSPSPSPSPAPTPTPTPTQNTTNTETEGVTFGLFNKKPDPNLKGESIFTLEHQGFNYKIAKGLDGKFSITSDNQAVQDQANGLKFSHPNEAILGLKNYLNDGKPLSNPVVPNNTGTTGTTGTTPITPKPPAPSPTPAPRPAPAPAPAPAPVPTNTNTGTTSTTNIPQDIDSITMTPLGVPKDDNRPIGYESFYKDKSYMIIRDGDTFEFISNDKDFTSTIDQESPVFGTPDEALKYLKNYLTGQDQNTDTKNINTPKRNVQKNKKPNQENQPEKNQGKNTGDNNDNQSTGRVLDPIQSKNWTGPAGNKTFTTEEGTSWNIKKGTDDKGKTVWITTNSVSNGPVAEHPTFKAARDNVGKMVSETINPVGSKKKVPTDPVTVQGPTTEVKSAKTANFPDELKAYSDEITSALGLDKLANIVYVYEGAPDTEVRKLLEEVGTSEVGVNTILNGYRNFIDARDKNNIQGLNVSNRFDNTMLVYINKAAVDSTTRTELPYIIAHELGHGFARILAKADLVFYRELIKRYTRELNLMKGRGATADEYIKVLGNVSKVDPRVLLEDVERYQTWQLGRYVTSFDEWFADQFQIWYHSKRAANSKEESFFKNLLGKFKNAYGFAVSRFHQFLDYNVKGIPNPAMSGANITFHDYMEKYFNRYTQTKDLLGSNIEENLDLIKIDVTDRISSSVITMEQAEERSNSIISNMYTDSEKLDPRYNGVDVFRAMATGILPKKEAAETIKPDQSIHDEQTMKDNYKAFMENPSNQRRSLYNRSKFYNDMSVALNQGLPKIRYRAAPSSKGNYASISDFQTGKIHELPLIWDKVQKVPFKESELGSISVGIRNALLTSNESALPSHVILEYFNANYSFGNLELTPTSKGFRLIVDGKTYMLPRLTAMTKPDSVFKIVPIDEFETKGGRTVPANNPIETLTEDLVFNSEGSLEILNKINTVLKEHIDSFNKSLNGTENAAEEFKQYLENNFPKLNKVAKLTVVLRKTGKIDSVQIDPISDTIVNKSEEKEITKKCQ